MSEASAAAERLQKYCNATAMHWQCDSNAGAVRGQCGGDAGGHPAYYACAACGSITGLEWSVGAKTACIACGKDAYMVAAPSQGGFRASRLQAPEGYGPLARVLDDALGQAAEGKGKERHANGEPFINQPIMSIARGVGEGYHLGQAIKKLLESQRLPTDRAIVERLGAINYIAASILLLEEERDELKD